MTDQDAAMGATGSVVMGVSAQRQKAYEMCALIMSKTQSKFNFLKDVVDKISCRIC
jgi:hypothetical protein